MPMVRVSNGGTMTTLTNCVFNHSTQSSGYPSSVYYDTGIRNATAVGVLSGKAYMVNQSSGSGVTYTDYSVSISSTGRVTLTSNVSGIGFFPSMYSSYIPKLDLVIFE